MIISTYMSTSVLFGILIPCCIQRDLLKRVEIGNQRKQYMTCNTYLVVWPADAVIYAVHILGSYSTKF